MTVDFGRIVEPPPAGTPAWYVRSSQTSDLRWDVRCYVSDEHGDGEIAEPTDSLADTYNLWHAFVGADGQSKLHVNPTMVPGVSELWYVSLPTSGVARRAGHPNQLTLVGFDTDHQPAGTVISDAEFFSLPVKNDQQAAAIRWWPDEAIVDQVFVAPAYRRKHVATTVIYAASAYHQHRGWPGRLHSDGKRTKLGEALVTGLRHPKRIAALDELMPPLDPSA